MGPSVYLDGSGRAPVESHCDERVDADPMKTRYSPALTLLGNFEVQMDWLTVPWKKSTVGLSAIAVSKISFEKGLIGLLFHSLR